MLLERFEQIETFFPKCHPGEAEWFAANVALVEDISPVFPYLNAIMKGAIFDQAHNTLNFKFGGHGVTLYPQKMIITRLQDRQEVDRILGELKNLINRSYNRRDKIEPSTKSRRALNAFEIYKLLPRTNCKVCGEPTCMAFAGRLLDERIGIEACQPLFTEEYAAGQEKLLPLLDEAGYAVPER
jgi:ArsR family metal-binding transcriptional regulator